MSKDVAIHEDDPFIAMVERLAANEAVDADKLDKLLDVQMRVMDRAARDEFYDAMNKVQAELPKVWKDRFNTQTSSRYATIEAIAAAIKPVYTKYGFSTSFTEGKPEIDGFMRINGVLRHRAGHSEDHYFVELPRDDRGIKGNVNKTQLHATGSTFTYGRRYLTCLMFDVATGDDTDGNRPSEFLSQEQASELQSLLEQLPTQTQNAFFRWAFGKKELDGEESPSDLNADCFDEYKKNLEAKIRKIRGNS